MPTFNPGLEATLSGSLAMAGETKQKYAELEHLLLALTENAEAAELLLACDCDIPRLRSALRDCFGGKFDKLNERDCPMQAAAFQRVIQRAIIHVQSSGQDSISGANVVVAMFAEKHSPAVLLLQEQNITRYDAVNFLAHGIRKTSRDQIIRRN